jgi:isocitrate/isopropylmalate dehydrogenase
MLASRFFGESAVGNAFKIAVLAGDAIGPEIMAQATRVFSVLSEHRDLAFDLIEAPFGAHAYFSHGKSFPEETKHICDSADAILKGPVGLSYEASSKPNGGRFFPSERDTKPMPISAPFI